MSGKIVILPGEPNDRNRDYLPEAIKLSDMVVNENGNNSQVYPERLREFTGVVADGVEDTWYEYVPARYDETKKTPLVVSMHGGLMTGWGQAIYTSWTLVADREGFIVLFPSARKDRFWIVETDEETYEKAIVPNEQGIYMHVAPKNPADNHDVKLTLGLIERMKRKYNIDEGRIFMQGMSLGNLMTSQMARHFGYLLAGKAGAGGAASNELLFKPSGEIKNDGGPLAVWQSRMEHDKCPPHYIGDTAFIVMRNRLYWMKVNQCDEKPEISILGEDNLAFYKGRHADMVFCDIKNRDHGQTLDDAELVWDYLFSGTRRDETGKIVHTEPNCPRTGDAYAFALAEGKTKAYVNNKLADVGGTVFRHRKLKYHGLNGDSIVRGEYFMAPVSFVAKVLGAKMTESYGGQSAELTPADGRELQFARGSIGCVVDNRVQSMFCEAVFRDGELYIPIEWICKRLLNLHTSVCGGVIYITDHYAELSINMAHLIRDEILVK